MAMFGVSPQFKPPGCLHMVVAVIGGAFISVLLCCGLFAAAFFSDKSGHDGNVRKPPSSAASRPACRL